MAASLIRRGFHASAAGCKKAKSASSSAWLRRQENDPYVAAAKAAGYRARSAYKLIEIDDKCGLLKRPDMAVVECGAAPGAWTQVACERIRGDGIVVGCDLLSIEPVDGAILFPGRDFTDRSTQLDILKALDGRTPDLVMSDMAPNASGTHSFDHDAIVKLAYSALRFAVTACDPGADFLCKVWNGGRLEAVQADLDRFYRDGVKVLKPKSSRKDSAEIFLLARNFRGLEK